MKFDKMIAALFMGIAVVACGNNAPAPAEGEEDGVPHKQTAKEVAPTKAEADSAAYLWGVNLGMMMKQYGFDELSFAKMKQGMDDAIKAKGTPRDTNFVKQFKISPEEMNRILDDYLTKNQEAKAIKNLEKQDAFFARIDKQGALKTESGLRYEIINAGKDPKPVIGDTVYVEYKLTDPEGTVVDESPAGEPVRMMLTSVIPGFREGLQLIGEGGEAVLYVPSDLGYGERGNSAIQPNTPLTFNIKITEIRVQQKEEAE